MCAFPTHKHLCSWAGICPGNNQSGGKLESIFFILRDGVDYQEMGPAYFDQINKEHIVRHYKKRLEAIGLVVEVSEAPVAA